MRNATVFAAPHRVMFLAGMTYLLVAALLWTVELGLRVGGGVPIPYPAPAGWLHAIAMIYGVLPFFIFGFAMTAMPRWQGLPALAPVVFRGAAAGLAFGAPLAFAGIWIPALMALGVALVLGGWALGAIHLARVAMHRTGERVHLIVVAVALCAGLLGVAVLVAAFFGDRPVMAHAGIEIGIWWFLAPVFVAVSHRVIPFFSSTALHGYTVRRPMWALWVLLAGLVSHGALIIAGASDWLWLADLPASAAALHLSGRWRLVRSFEDRLLAMHHVAFLWLGIALVMLGVQSLLAGAGMPALGLAPLHALTIGFFGSMLFGMATRVTIGHSGQRVLAGPAAWIGFWSLQCVVAIRIAADLADGAAAAILAFAASAGWLAVFVAWSVLHMPMLWRPRVDGLPG
jgi:uncharacterized protein involved in response to NO